jgi:hypothetical protein
VNGEKNMSWTKSGQRIWPGLAQQLAARELDLELSSKDFGMDQMALIQIK